MSGDVTGPCTQCEHYRTGSSIARAAYAGILPAYQPKLRQAQTLKIQEESQTLSTFVQERETPPEYADVQWLARPTHPSFHYCGLDEFEGRYYKCEVKNAEQSCPDFVQRSAEATSHPCSSCCHNRPPLGHPVQVLEATFRRYGKDSRQNLTRRSACSCRCRRTANTRTASTTPASCPSRQLAARLPDPALGGTTTGEQRTVVGPVVNSAARCGEWAAGQGSSLAAEAAQLDALVAHVRGVVSQSESRSYMAPWQVGARCDSRPTPRRRSLRGA